MFSLLTLSESSEDKEKSQNSLLLLLSRISLVLIHENVEMPEVLLLLF